MTAILEVAFPIPLHKTFDYLPPPDVSEDSLDDWVGRRIKAPFGFKFGVGVVVNLKHTTSTSVTNLKRVYAPLDPEPLLDAFHLDLGLWLSVRTACSLGEALFSLLPPGKQFRESAPQDVIFGEGPDGSSAYSLAPPQLTEDQQKAVDKIHTSIFNGPSKIFLLSGVAAAGKTEVYFSAVRDVLSQAKSVLFLVPEIGLAVQAAEWLKSRFGDESVCLWHSDQKPKDRFESWWRVRRSQVSIVVGTRSAVLLPISNLGVVIVDEEHDSAYKEERKPRFHARTVAIERARRSSAIAILGSATPSMEMRQMAHEGAAELLDLRARAVLTGIPRVEIVDMKSARVKGALSEALEKKISERLKSNEQTILFLNRRGFHRSLRCTECSWVAVCPSCAVILVSHKSGGGGLLCHLCGHVAPVPTKCPHCGKKKIKATGFGTERVADEVQQKFPWARVLRWDRDTVFQRGGHEKIFRQFASGDFDVLVGTQLVTQGFHFPKVSLVGVINADVPLHLPDFRAAERTFQLLMQVAGRAGRELVGGEVVIQTRNTDHYALAYVKNFDYIGFSEAELEFRKELNYPPFTHLIRVRSENRNEEKRERELDRFIAWIRTIDSESTIGVLGPTKGAQSKTRKKGLQVLLKIPKEAFPGFLTNLNQYLAENSTRFWLDVDPESVG